MGGTALGAVYLANPVTLVVLGFQKVFWVSGAGQLIPSHLGERLGICLVVGLVLLWLCQRIFARMQATFAQEL